MRPPPLRLRLLPTLLGVLIVTLVLAAGARAATGAQPAEPPLLREPGDTLIEFRSNAGEQVTAVAGSFEVPEYSGEPASRAITLRYVRFPATGENPGPPIVYLAGGPGGSGIGTAKWRRFPLFMAMREFGDVIAFEQRGTGESFSPPECRASVVIPADEAMDDESFARLHRDAARECLAFWKSGGTDLRGYTTVESVRDLSALREHLGADRLSLWGISYGSHLALAAMKAIPDELHRVIIASVEGLDQTVKLPSRTDAYFVRVGEALGVDDLPALMRSVHTALDEEPVMLELGDSENSKPYLLHRRDMQRMASAAIADPQWAAQLVALYGAAASGDYGPVQGLMARFVSPGEPISYRAMPLAMDRASGISAGRLKRVMAEAETSLLGAYLNFPMPQLIDELQFLDLGDDFREDPVSAVPTLVLSGTLDGRTYPEAQLEATAGLSNAERVTVAGAGHNLFMTSPEVTAVMEDFMAGRPLGTHEITVTLE